MREVKAGRIRDAAADLAQKANFVLRGDVVDALKSALTRETDQRARKILKAIINNAETAKREKLAICQDTGLPVVFGEIGSDARITGGSLPKAINQGLELGYAQGSLRRSIVKDPISRGGFGWTPAVIHTEIVKGDKIKLSILPKGFGCENKSRVRMFNPTAAVKTIKEFIVQVVKDAGPDACPPFIVGVGIGGTQDYAGLLAKKALLRRLNVSRLCRDPDTASGKRHNLYGKLELDLLKEINRLNIGPMGLGGKTTCLGVNILSYPTHIAGLPVAVNISCHALRSAVKII